LFNNAVKASSGTNLGKRVKAAIRSGEMDRKTMLEELAKVDDEDWEEGAREAYEDLLREEAQANKYIEELQKATDNQNALAKLKEQGEREFNWADAEDDEDEEELDEYTLKYMANAKKYRIDPSNDFDDAPSVLNRPSGK